MIAIDTNVLLRFLFKPVDNRNPKWQVEVAEALIMLNYPIACLHGAPKMKGRLLCSLLKMKKNWEHYPW